MQDGHVLQTSEIGFSESWPRSQGGMRGGMVRASTELITADPTNAVGGGGTVGGRVVRREREEGKRVRERGGGGREGEGES